MAHNAYSMHIHAEFCMLMWKSAFKSTNLYKILHYNSHAEVMRRNSHYKGLRRSVHLKTEFAHTWFKTIENVNHEENVNATFTALGKAL